MMLQLGDTALAVASLADDRIVADVHRLSILVPAPMVVERILPGRWYTANRSPHRPNHHIPAGEQAVISFGTVFVKRIAADNGTRIDNDPIADTRTIANDHPACSTQSCPISTSLPMNTPGLDRRSPAYLGIGSDHGRRGDKRTERTGCALV